MHSICRHPAALVLVLMVQVLTHLAAASFARASEPPTVMVVFDGSGSMWGKMPGERSSKLSTGRDALRQGLSRLPEGARVGLASFGHRRGGDCSDAELILKAEPLDAERIMVPLDQLNPRGRGPITRALRELVGELGPQSAPSSIILIHDGLDNCQQDPCSAVGELRQSHPQVRVHVVTFGLPPDEAQQMICLPQATGGRHFVVTDEQGAMAAVTEAMQLASAQPQPAAVAATPQSARRADPAAREKAVRPHSVPTGRPGLQLLARLVKDGPPVGLPLTWRVRKAGGEGPVLWEGIAASPLLALPSGQYEVEATSGLVSKKAPAEAEAGKPTRLDMVLDAGTMVMAETTPAMTMLNGAVISLAQIDKTGVGPPQILRQTAGEVALPAGNYLFSLTRGTLRVERPIGITPGSRISIANALAFGEIVLTSAARKDGPRLEGVVFVIYEDDPDAPQGRREVARSAAGSPSFRLQAGTYLVIARKGEVETRERIIVRAGEVTQRELLLDSGRISLAISLPGDLLEGRGPIAHRLERIGAQAGTVIHASGPSATVDVPAGRYRVDTRVGIGNVRAVREIDLKAGESENVAIQHPAGAARLRLLEKTGTRPMPDVAWEVLDGKGQTVWVGLGTQVSALLLAGRYKVRAESRAQKTENLIDIRAGETRDIDLVLR